MRVSLSKILGWTFIGLAAVATGAEVDRYQSLSAADEIWEPVSSLSVWELFGGGSLEGVRAFSAEHLPPAVWDPVATSVLSLPPAVLFAALGLFFMLVARLRLGQIIPEPRGALRASMAFVGAVLAISGLAVFGADLAIDASGVTLDPRSAATLWQQIHPASFERFQNGGPSEPGAARSGDAGQETSARGDSRSAPPPEAAESRVATVLAWPAWLVLLVPGLVLATFGSIGRRAVERRAIPIPQRPRARTREGERVLEKRAQFLDQMQERPRPPRREPRTPIPPTATPPVETGRADDEGADARADSDPRPGGAGGSDPARSEPGETGEDGDPHKLRLVQD